MLEELALYTDMGTSPVKRYTGKLDVIHKALAELKQYIADHPLADQQDEINFFKYEKPAFVCELLYARQLFAIETQRREFTEELLIRNYFEQELKLIKHSLLQYQFLYQYFILEACELDNLLFVRGAEAPAVVLPETPDLDPDYSTKGDYLFAQFMACEKLQQYLMELLYPATEGRPETRRTMSWPGDKTDLIEMAYGLYCWLRAHSSTVTIAEVIGWLETSFGITLPRHYRRFAEIKMRKISSRTKFWDEARELLQKYMEDGDV